MSFTYTVEKDTRFGGFNVFQCDPPTSRYAGKRPIAHVNSVAEGEAKIQAHLQSEKELREAITRHGAVGVGSHVFHEDERYER